MIVTEVTETKRAWNDYWNNIGSLHWDFGVPGTDSDTVLLSMVDNFEDTVSFTFPDDTIYTITLTSIGNAPCSNATNSMILTIEPTPITAPIWHN